MLALSQWEKRKLESCGKSMVVPGLGINYISTGCGSAGLALPFASLTVPQNLLLGSLWVAGVSDIHLARSS